VNQRLKRDWVLTEDGFNKLLEVLDPDRQRAAERYEHVRRSLIRYFDWRGSTSAEKDADDTIDRVARKLDEREVDDVYAYALGVARNVARESLRIQQNERRSLETVSPIATGPEDALSEQRFECFERCLGSLAADKQELILSYYQGDKRTKIASRRRMAERAGIPINRLRIQAHRIRERLETCINHFVSKNS
jgi:DNA-directed RNA polymerase specialized sigma24 family protein